MVCARLLARLIADLLELAHLSLLPGLSNKPQPVHPSLFAIAITVHNEQHQARDVLELDKPQGDVCGTLVVPVLFRELKFLGRTQILCLVKSQVVRLIGEQLDGSRPQGGIFFVIVVAGR